MTVPSNSRGKDRGMSGKPKFRVGQVVCWKSDELALVRIAEIKNDKARMEGEGYWLSAWIWLSEVRALTKRERGQP